MSTPTARSSGPRAATGAVVPGTVDPSPRRRRRRRGVATHPLLYLFPLPALIVYVVFFALPTVQALQYAATDWNGFSPSFRYLGLANFSKVLGGDSLFTNALVNNVKFMLVAVIGQTAVSLVLALLLSRNSRSTTLVRGLFFFPTILSSVSVAFVWKFVYDPNFGLANTVTGAVGLDSLQSSFLGNPRIAIFCIALTQVWFHAGQMMVIYVAGLQQVPTQMYEAAELDGAVGWQRFRYITWPMILPATSIVIAYTTIQSFQAFDLVLGISGNPPAPSLDILSTRIYTTFANFQYGYAAAESVVFMVVIAFVTWFQRQGIKATGTSSP